MNWKYLVGKNLQQLENKLTKSNLNFVNKNFPYGRNWIFDLKRILNQPVNTIFDIGANIGSVSKECSTYFPKSKIYAFEPISNTFKTLKNNTSFTKNIIPINFALGKTEESVEIFLNPENTINSLKSDYLNENNSLGKETIEIKRLDYYCQAENINQIDILKIDVEGFEFEVLEGCGNFLGTRIKCILLEVGYEREPTKVHFSDVESYLEKYNYQLCGVYEIMRNLNDKRKISYSNNLYLNKEILKLG